MKWQKKRNQLAVYLEGRRRRSLVGYLVYDPDEDRFAFTYDDEYLHSMNAIPLGPELSLKKASYRSEKGILFPSFADRIPDKKNPAYAEYCISQGISPSEQNSITLLTTIGRKGPSSFIYEPVYEEDDDIRQQFNKWRNDLDLSFADIADAFDMNLLSMKRLASGESRDRNLLQLLRIYLSFPDVALWKLEKSGARLHADTQSRLKGYFESLDRRRPSVEANFLDWYAKQKEKAYPRMDRLFEKRGFVELSATILDGMLTKDQDQLKLAAQNSQINTFGWPIGIVLEQDPHRPISEKDGVNATVSTERSPTEKSFDYWALRRNGDYFTLMSLFEDMRDKDAIFLDTRAVRAAEALLHLSLLYKNLGVEPNSRIHVRILHGGLKGRHLTAANPMRRFTFSYQRKSQEDEVVTEFTEKLADIEPKLNELVYRVILELCLLFEFFLS